MKISSVNGDPNCKICKGGAWVCEKHPEKVWGGCHPEGCHCGAPGMPCKCSPLHKDNWQKTMQERNKGKLH